MPSPKTTKCIKLLCILCLCRITVYAQRDAIPLTRIDHNFSVSENSFNFIRNKYFIPVSAAGKQTAKMLPHVQQMQKKLHCYHGLDDIANASVLFYSSEKASRQLQDKFKPTIDKALQNAIITVRRLPASKKFMQQNSMLTLLFGTPVNYDTRQQLEGLKINEQEESLINQRVKLHMAASLSTGTARVNA